MWRNALDLDIELAAGAVPSSSPELALRTEQLLRWHHRTQLAKQLTEMARAVTDHEMAEELHRLALRVSHFNDRDVVPIATASCVVQQNRFQSRPAEQHLRPAEEARLRLRGSSPL